MRILLKLNRENVWSYHFRPNSYKPLSNLNVTTENLLFTKEFISTLQLHQKCIFNIHSNVCFSNNKVYFSFRNYFILFRHFTVPVLVLSMKWLSYYRKFSMIKQKYSIKTIHQHRATLMKEKLSEKKIRLPFVFIGSSASALLWQWESSWKNSWKHKTQLVRFITNNISANLFLFYTV